MNSLSHPSSQLDSAKTITRYRLSCLIATSPEMARSVISTPAIGGPSWMKSKRSESICRPLTALWRRRGRSARALLRKTVPDLCLANFRWSISKISSAPCRRDRHAMPLLPSISTPDSWSWYEKFWDAPLKAPPLWIALLFAVLSLTTTLRNVAGGSAGPKSARPTAKTLQQRTVECLILGRFPNANAYALEAMILHLQSCYLTLNRLGSDHWFEMGTLIRLAFRMGYHHDPDGLPGISVFDGEMRRRVWHNIFQVDALMSFQMGFPSMIPTEFCDTKVPRNLQFSDLEINMTLLPPGRPLFENTPIRYPIAKSGVMAVFKRIVAHSQSLSLPTYDNTIMLDNEMREAYNNLPEILRGRDVGRSFMDPSNIIFERCTIEMLYLKGLIVLHRRYISYEVDGRRFEHSRRTCAEAALDILARQADLHQACQPGGRLYDDRWMVSSLTMHDFLLAAMVICLDLSVRLRRPSSVLVPGRDDDALTGREYHALQRSQTIWASSSQMSPEARLASLALGLMVQKVADKDARHIPLSKSPEEDLAAAASTQELPYAGPMSQMIDGTEGLDWGLLDQYFQNQPTDASQLDPFSIDPGWFDLPL
ncbi:hypothetical protein TsFJ059_000215 [Trichoderma semiorbis]|uniref:Xylanolytic transcriptional activator regulatory domain-containing protein n=1 Tax=Trichoderma semiorbis TaxID=1491008 RepID=A0A9P8HPF4_9HYPO|nr:hypothetical protein TsFJ059_000215 [Trichoderma semiorbis]